MTKITLTILLLVVTLTTISAQNRTYIGAEAAVTHDIYEIADYGTELKEIPLINGLWGLNIRQDLNKKVFLEIGLLRKYYNEGIGFKTSGGYSETNAITAWLIPLRLGTRMNLNKEKIHLVSVLGLVYGINSDYGYGGGSGFEKVSGGDSIYYSYTSYYNFSKRLPLIQAGLGLEFKLFQTALLSLSTNYYAGLKKLIQQDITYTVNNGLEQRGTAISKGDTFGLGVALKYPISSIWTKTKD